MSVFSSIKIALILCNIVIAFFALSRNNIKTSNRSFAAMLIALSMWVFGTFLENISDNSNIIRIGLLIDFGFAPIIFTLFLLFSKTFPSGNITARDFLHFIPVASLIILLLFSKKIIASVDSKSGEPVVQTGQYFIAYGIVIVSYAFSGVWVLLKRYRKSIGITRQQTQYVLYGITISSLIALTTNLVVPRLYDGVFADSVTPQIGVLGIMIFVFSTFVAIIKHKLLDIRFVVSRSLIYGILVTIIALFFIFSLLTSAKFFGDSAQARNIEAFIISTLIVFSLDPLKRFLSRITDKIFFKAKIDYQAVLQRLTEVLSIELNLDRLVANLTDVLQKELKIKSAVIALRKQGNLGDVYTAFSRLGVSVRVPEDHALIKRLRQRLHPSILEELVRKLEDEKDVGRHKQLEQSRQVFKQYGAAVIAPIFSQNSLNAVLIIGPKLSGESFSNDDLQLIEVLSPQIGSAIQKANLYEEVRAFGERLKKRVEEATVELKDRNISLMTLQQITKEVTRTLDFNKVVQNIADAVSKQLGYVGAILVFVDDDGHTIRARAITNTPLTNKAMKLLPKPFSEFTTDLNDPKQTNLAHAVIKTGQIRFTEEFADVISPPVPKPLAQAIQRLIGVRTLVVTPIVSEERVIGVIEIGVRKPQEQITEREIETMQSVADQLGVVSRNLRLFEQLRQANIDLEDANRHLQQLDQAKSEFVSIASHQLRTPMTGIMGYLSMLTAGDFGDLKVEHIRILKNLLLESQRMIRLINLFLNVSKIEAGKFEIHPVPTDLVPIIEDQVKEVQKMADEKGLKLAFNKPSSPLPHVLVDQDKIHDVILNLIDNAIKYTAKGSVTVTAEAGASTLTVHVRDTGVGIPPDQVPELFNKFVRGSGIARIHPDGSGLGLFIAKRIVEGHRGRIWVESEGEGKGSTFSFSLPLSA